MRLIEVGWITFEETQNVSMNPLLYHTLESRSTNALNAKCPENLKALMVKAGWEEGIMNS